MTHFFLTLFLVTSGGVTSTTMTGQPLFSIYNSHDECTRAGQASVNSYGQQGGALRFVCTPTANNGSIKDAK